VCYWLIEREGSGHLRGVLLADRERRECASDGCAIGPHAFWLQVTRSRRGTQWRPQVQPDPKRNEHQAPRTTHHAPRTTHHAPRTTHHAPRTTHHAPRTTHPQTPTTHHAPTDTQRHPPTPTDTHTGLHTRMRAILVKRAPCRPQLVTQPNGANPNTAESMLKRAPCRP
jgi:hypothetical protein